MEVKQNQKIIVKNLFSDTVVKAKSFLASLLPTPAYATLSVA